jgi:hypothetical protein
MASETNNADLDCSEKEWWAVGLKERNAEDFGFLCSIVEIKDDCGTMGDMSELADFLYGDAPSSIPEWLIKKINRYEVTELLSLGEGSHGYYYGLYSLWDNEARIGLLLHASVDGKTANLTSFYKDTDKGLSASVYQCLKQVFNFCEPTDTGKRELGLECLLDPEHVESKIDKELKQLIRYLYKITEGGSMRDEWLTAEDWIDATFPKV